MSLSPLWARYSILGGLDNDSDVAVDGRITIFGLIGRILWDLSSPSRVRVRGSVGSEFTLKTI